jgi:hypothetical protein
MFRNFGRFFVSLPFDRLRTGCLRLTLSLKSFVTLSLSNRDEKAAQKFWKVFRQPSLRQAQDKLAQADIKFKIFRHAEPVEVQQKHFPS